MEWSPNFLISLTLLSLSTVWLLRRLLAGPSRFPPGPPGWPIIGNMLDLGSMPHRTLFDLKPKYGDVIWLRLGAINSMAILSAKAAADFFKNHDLSFADRTTNETMRAHGYDQGSLALAPYGAYWRVLRRLLTVDMVVTKRINESTSIRRKCVDEMLLWIEDESRKAAERGVGVHVVRFVVMANFNLLGNLMLSRNLFDPSSEAGSEFLQAILALIERTGHANMADFFPWLKRFDLQGLQRKMERDLGKALVIASKFVKERWEEKKKKTVDGNGRKKDFLDVLLEFQGTDKDGPEKISDKGVNIVVLEIFLAGSETASSTIEWALTELLCNRASMAKAKSELDEVVGKARNFEESDIDNLPYLQAVVNETLRLHPPIPFLVPRKAIQDTEFMGYQIPKNTQVLVNTWAIGRDPEVWDDPLSFRPERFIGSKVDFRGQHYKFLPFGAGRRMCAGIPLAHRVLHLILGSLLQRFEWELFGDVDPGSLDMRDRLGVTTRKFEPLIVTAKKCM